MDVRLSHLIKVYVYVYVYIRAFDWY